MTRSALDRVVTAVVALVLVAGGVTIAAWGTRRVPDLRGTIDLGRLRETTAETWWPWALGAAGVLLLLLALRGVFAHRPAPGAGRIPLAGSGPSGRLCAETGPLARAGAQALAARTGAHSAHGRLFRERGRFTARIRASVGADADLEAVAAGCAEVSRALRGAGGRDDLDCQVVLRLSGDRERRPRVR